LNGVTARARSIDGGLRRFVFFLWGIVPLPGLIRGMILGAGNSWFLVGANAVVLEGDRVLIARHTYRRRRPWGLPAGWVRQGEDPAAAVRREVEEETGFVIDVGPPVAVRLADDPPHVDVAYLCRLVGGSFRPCAEISEARLVSIAEAERLLPQKDMAHVRTGMARRAEMSRG